MRISTRSTPRWSSATIPAAGPAGDRRRRGRARRQLRGEGVRRPYRDGRRPGRLCPQAIVVQPRMSAYSEASKAVFAVFHHTTPLVEGLSIDEAFLDVGGLARISGTPVDIAARLRAEVHEQVGLPITVGMARTKFLAKVASGVAKPDGLLLVPPDGELDFLHPLPVRGLWGVGEKTEAQARRPRHPHRRRHHPAQRGVAGLDRRQGVGAAPACARQLPRPAPGGHRSAATFARLPPAIHRVDGSGRRSETWGATRTWAS